MWAGLLGTQQQLLHTNVFNFAFGIFKHCHSFLMQLLVSRRWTSTGSILGYHALSTLFHLHAWKQNCSVEMNTLRCSLTCHAQTCNCVQCSKPARSEESQAQVFAGIAFNILTAGCTLQSDGLSKIHAAMSKCSWKPLRTHWLMVMAMKNVACAGSHNHV